MTDQSDAGNPAAALDTHTFDVREELAGELNPLESLSKADSTVSVSSPSAGVPDVSNPLEGKVCKGEQAGTANPSLTGR
eukprot:580365-Prorocentrum_minimum.AAC.2